MDSDEVLVEEARAVPSGWASECRKYHGRVLIGPHAHWCNEWDGLPLDATCEEFGKDGDACKTCGYSDDRAHEDY